MDDPATSDRNGPVMRPRHVAFTVADLTRARAWYAAALRYELQFDFQPPGVSSGLSGSRACCGGSGGRAGKQGKLEAGTEEGSVCGL
jgi:catechol 2,3-dioxygenase-like lactoylglutathione lyase family enzyme